MGIPVVAGDKCLCCFGTAPATLNATPGTRIKFQNKPCLFLTDIALGVNFMPPFFGSCNSPVVLSKPPFSPMPCAPVLSPWKLPTTKTKYSSAFKIIMKNSMCKCEPYQGVIQLMPVPGTAQVN